MNAVQALEVDVATIHDVECSGGWHQQVQNIDVVELPVGDMDELGNAPPHIQQRMQLDRRLGLAKPSRWEKREAQIDGGRVQDVDRRVDLHAGFLPSVLRLGLGDEHLSKLGLDAPVSRLLGVGQGAAGNRPSKAKVLEFRADPPQTDLDIPQALPVGQLGKGHAQEPIQATERSDLSVSLVAVDTAVKLAQRQKIHDLGENKLSGMHQYHPLFLLEGGSLLEIKIVSSNPAKKTFPYQDIRRS